jgi:hypothetical protein
MRYAFVICTVNLGRYTQWICTENGETGSHLTDNIKGVLRNVSTPASAEVKKIWIYTSTLPYTFMAYCLIS